MGALAFLAVFAIAALAVHYFVRPQAPPQPRVAPKHAVTLSPLGRAIASGDGERMRGWLSTGTDPNEAARDDMPALHTACSVGATALVRELLDAGAALDHADRNVGSALSYALARRDVATARVLLEAGIALDLTNDGGAHALHVAAMTGDIEIVRAIVERGLAVDRPNDQGGTALRSAASAGHAGIVRYLLDRGARPDGVDAFDKRPADYAAEAGHDAVVALLASAGSSTDPPAMLAHRGTAHLLPKRSDATLNAMKTASARGAMMVEVAASSLEAPSCVHALRTRFPELVVGVGHIDDPDPREPVRPVRFRVWTYASESDPQPALAKPDAETMETVRTIALVPYSEAVWWEHAELEASLDEDAIRALLAAMVHPGAPPPYLEPWDWWLRVQVASAFAIARAESSPWAGSLRREVLTDVADGPADWTNTAAITALTAVARHLPEARDDVRETLRAIAERKPTPPAYQHAIEPAILALLELGDLDAEEVGRLEARLDR